MKITQYETFSGLLKKSSAWVQAFFLALVTVWVGMPAEYQQAILGAVGLTPERMLLASALMWAGSSLMARATSISFGAGPGEPETFPEKEETQS